MLAKANDPFNTAKPRAKSVQRSTIHVEDLEVADDPPPQKRSMGPGRYDELFESMKPGQCIKCEPEHTGAISNALRNWIKRKRKKNLAVQAASHYPACKDKLGRVWLVAAPEPASAKQTIKR
jgi:hypothetical protein